MKIAVWHNLNSGGGKRALYEHVKGLVERGHQVTCFCPDTANPDYLPLSELTEEVVLPLKAKLEKRKSKFKYFNSYELIAEKLQSELEHCEECAAIINSGGFDVLFANSSSYFSISHIGRFVKLPSAIYLGEPHRFLYESSEYFIWRAPKQNGVSKLSYLKQRAKQLYRMFWYSIVLREEYLSAAAYTTILVNSFFSRESVKRSYRLDSKVCYLGIDTNRFTNTQVAKEAYVIGLGAVINNKGIEQAIDALAYIDAASRPPLLWIGNRKQSDYVSQLQRYAQSKGVTINIVTNLTDSDLQDALAKACAMLYFSHLEPFGLAPLEANACGTAVISINEGGMKETIVDGLNGYKAANFDPSEIAALIKPFVTDLDYALRFGMQSRQYVLENWNREQGINNIEQRLGELITSHKQK